MKFAAIVHIDCNVKVVLGSRK